jgi:hypothetical protein
VNTGIKNTRLFEFIIPATWSMSGEVHVKAVSLEDAILQANEISLDKFYTEYMDGSFEINEDIMESYPLNVASEEASKECYKIDETPEKDLPC